MPVSPAHGSGAPSACVTGTGSYLPQRILTNQELEEWVETTDEWIRSRTGICERRIASAEETTSDLAVHAARRALEGAGRAAEEVELLVLATSTPDYLLPSTACVVQGKLGAHCPAFDVMAVCSGFVYALDVAWRYLTSGAVGSALVIGAETYSRILNWQDRTTCVFFGDGAGAVLLGQGPPGHGLLASSLHADGKAYDVIWVPAGGARQPATTPDLDPAALCFHMDGPLVWEFATEALPACVRSCLSQCHLTPRDIDLLVPHQANATILAEGARKLGLANERVYSNLDRYGNTSAASVPIALDEAAQGGKIQAGDLVTLVGYGGGLTWGACALRW